MSYNNSPLPPGNTAIFLNLSSTDEPVLPLPLIDTNGITAGKPIFVYLLHIYSTEQIDTVPAEYNITMYSQYSLVEVENWIKFAKAMGSFEEQSRIVAHTVACLNNSSGTDFIPQTLPFSGLPEFTYMKINTELVTGASYQYEVADPAQNYSFTATAQDAAANLSGHSNITAYKR